MGVFLLLGLLSLHNLLWGNIMQGTGYVQSINLVPLIVQVVNILIAVVAVLTGFGLKGIVLAYLVSLFMGQVIGFLTLNGISKFRFTPSINLFKLSLMYGGIFYINGLLLYGQSRIDQFVTNNLLGPQALGILALSITMGELLWSLDLPVIAAAQHHIAAESKGESISLINKLTRLIIIVQSLACSGMGLISIFAIPLIYGEAFRPAIIPLLVYLPGVFFWSLLRSLSQYTAYQLGKPAINLGLSAFSVISKTLFVLFLVPRFGIVGATVSSTLSNLLTLLLTAGIYVRLSQSELENIFIPKSADFSLLKGILVNSVQRFWKIIGEFSFTSG